MVQVPVDQVPTLHRGACGEQVGDHGVDALRPLVRVDVPAPDTFRSRWSRFFARLGSGTLRNGIAGRTPPGSQIAAPSPHSSGGTS